MLQRIKELYNDRKNLKDSLLWLMHISLPYRGSILFLILVNCSITAVGVATAAINKHIIDGAVSSRVLLPYIVIAVAVSLFSLSASVLLNILTVRITEKYSFHIRSELYRHVLNSVWTERTSRHSEDYLSRMTSDVNAVTNGVTDVSINIVTTVFQFVMAFLLIWHYDSSLALVALVSGPVAAFVSLFIAARLKKIQEEIQRSEAEYRKFLQEHISHADVIKVFGREVSSIENLHSLHNKRFYWIKKRNKLNVWSTAIISTVFSGTYLFAFITGAIRIASGEITYGTMTAFLSLMGQVQMPVLALAGLIPKFVGILASTGRVMEISDMKTEPVLCLPENFAKTPVGLRINNVKLAYGDRVVVDNFSMDIKPGETVMISGSSGIGKTTLLRTVLGFLIADSGTAEFYDADGNTMTCCAQTRQYISYVPQGNTLFSGTIAENLRFGNPDADEEQMCGALKDACAWDFVSGLDDGIETIIGERGCGLSEGQAQRIAIARAFLKPYELLIMDEATSALDEDTEHLILDNIKKKRKTCIFVSHRKTVACYADKVVKIKD